MCKFLIQMTEQANENVFKISSSVTYAAMRIINMPPRLKSFLNKQYFQDVQRLISCNSPLCDTHFYIYIISKSLQSILDIFSSESTTYYFLHLHIFSIFYLLSSQNWGSFPFSFLTYWLFDYLSQLRYLQLVSQENLY